MARKRSNRRARGEGAIFFSETKGCWIGRAIVGLLPSGKPRYKEVSAQTQGQALTKKQKAEEDAKAGRLPDGKPMTVGQYLTHWQDNVAKPSVRETTWASYERCVRLHLIPNLGGIKLAQLRPVHVEQFFADISRAGVSKGNAKKVGEVLSTALEQAVRTGLIPVSPARPVAKPQPPEEEIIPFTPDEIRRIRVAAADQRLEAMFALAIGTGAREGELLGLARQHVDLDQGTVSIQRSLAVVKGGWLLKEPKSKRGRRIVDLPRFCVDALREHFKKMLAEGNAGAPVLFCTRTGHFISKSSFVRQVHAPLLAKAKVPYRKFHTFRHTHVSQLLQQGESVVDVARRVGDRPEVILKSYAHFLPGGGAKIVSRLDSLYGAGKVVKVEEKPEGGVKVESA
jgi:integrase